MFSEQFSQRFVQEILLVIRFHNFRSLCFNYVVNLPIEV
jgi:hypothetical protein